MNCSIESMDYGYLLPYFKKDNQIDVLLGVKKSINKRDGFIHNNPGQTIICGGRYRNDENKDNQAGAMVYNIIKKFNKQCGGVPLINPNNLNQVTHVLQYNGKYIGFYEMTIKEYHYFANEHHQNYQKSSITKLKWVKLTDALKIFSSIKNNPPCHGQIQNEIDKYMECMPQIFNDFNGVNGVNSVNGVKNYHQRGNNEFLNDFMGNIKIMTNINKYGSKSKYYPLLKLYLYEYIMEKSKIDWFETMIIIFSKVVVVV